MPTHDGTLEIGGAVESPTTLTLDDLRAMPATEIAVAAGIVDRETLDATGDLLDAHVRLEGRQLSPLIEELVPDGELRTLGLADRDATCAVRRPPLTGWS